jgi:type IV secretory pathway VirB10-like protein
MRSNRLTLGALAAACIAASAVGGYFATRQNAQDRTLAAEPVAGSDDRAGGAPAAGLQPVQETEAVIGDAAPVPAPPAAASEASRPARPAPAAAPRARERTPAPATARAPELPTLSQSWPSSGTVAPREPPPSAPIPEPSAPSAEPAQEATPVAEAVPETQFEELVVPADSVIGLQLESTISSERARIEDPVEARVIRDVRVDGEVAIPSGARAIGSVVGVERGGKFKERARLSIRFHTLVLADGTRLPVSTQTIERYGDPPGNASAAKIGGGAVGGAILGAILGGAKGAAVGAAAGAGGGAAVVAAGDREAAIFASGTQVTAKFNSPVTITVER